MATKILTKVPVKFVKNHFQFPKEAFIAWKKVIHPDSGVRVLAKLLIPAKAQKILGAADRGYLPENYVTFHSNRKMRADQAKVLGFYSCTTGRRLKLKKAHSSRTFDGKSNTYAVKPFTYTVGRIARPHKFSPDKRKQCAPGIHFFLSKDDASFYCL